MFCWLVGFSLAAFPALMGWQRLKPSSCHRAIVPSFQGVLCLFLLDMGLVAERGLRGGTGVLTPGVLVFGIVTINDCEVARAERF
ncbi:sodium-dependent bicarbonate transport family permease [Tateyamaria sp.]|uniref:sodium-dependent bicarbonate transport family permease n=1 Tax=Tateyamaria sp. TaxID=1929288 RepID=UPI0039B92B6C